MLLEYVWHSIWLIWALNKRQAMKVNWTINTMSAHAHNHFATFMMSGCCYIPFRMLTKSARIDKVGPSGRDQIQKSAQENVLPDFIELEFSRPCKRCLLICIWIIADVTLWMAMKMLPFWELYQHSFMLHYVYIAFCQKFSLIEIKWQQSIEVDIRRRIYSKKKPINISAMVFSESHKSPQRMKKVLFFYCMP